MDSLINELLNSGKFLKSYPVEFSMEKFQRFESKNTNEHYDVFITSKGKLKEYIGLTAVNRKFDNEGRLIRRIGYNINGKYFLWDYPAITEFTYHQDTTIETTYNSNYLFSSSTTTITDSKGRIIEIIYNDKKPEYYKRIVQEYLDSLNELTIKNYEKNGKLMQDKKGLAIHYKKFDSVNEKLILEERFYDINGKLINSNHNFSNVDCIYSIIRRKIENKEVFTYYYNSEEELICEESSENPGIFFYFGN